MNMDNSNGQFDSDSPQRKGDILRARDIIPGARPYGNAGGRETDSQQTETNEATRPAEPKRSPATKLVGDNVPEIGSEQAKAVGDMPGVASKTEQPGSKIPRFDLAEEIMAEQRRITATRRKAPGQQYEAQRQVWEAEPVGDTPGRPVPTLSEQEQIVADIVASDIEKLCRGDTLDVSV
ncbi:MAG: hypothetical protein FVQ85_12375 [Planctomycetes bacterium]|nr:hypothetical protein [Planctomycetota bacterium]